jgi:hypothetical protein
MYVYYKRKDHVQAGIVDTKRAAGVYSERIQRGGETTYGTVPIAQEPARIV